MPATYNPFLVALSVLIAVRASYDALQLAGWSVHFVAMLALRLPVSVN